MAKIKLTRPELKRARDALARYSRYLPMLKLKQQQLQMTLRDTARRRGEARDRLDEAQARLRRYEAVMADWAGVPLEPLARPEEIKTTSRNIAGVNVPVLEEVRFARPSYSLFGTPPWVDRALADLRDRSRRLAEMEVIDEERRLLEQELTRVVQRVNLFEQVMIPRAQNTIRLIRIRLGDEMTAAVGRAKIAKRKLAGVGAPDGETEGL